MFITYGGTFLSVRIEKTSNTEPRSVEHNITFGAYNFRHNAVV